jgi:uncharacterized integral membrane protein
MLPRPEVLINLLRNPLFWLFVLLNGLSTGISYLLQTREFPLPIVLMLAVFALGNMLYGIRIALRLMRAPRASKASSADC